MRQIHDLAEIARLFFRMGCIAFGGPAAHIALMEVEVVRKRNWISHAHFLDLIGATNLIPGPNSTEMAMHCGQERAGWKGLVVAGVCFIFPSVVITSGFAWLYQLYGNLPQVQPFLYGINAAVVALIVSALIPLAKKAVKSTELAMLGVATIVACLSGVNELAALFGCGFVGVLLYLVKTYGRNRTNLFSGVLMQILAMTASEMNLAIFRVFFKVGCLLYGSGYVLFAFLDAELVQTHVLSRTVLTDAIAVGQFTPGPVLSSATFIGWQLNSLSGALTATVGVFLPSFLFVALLNPLLPRLRKSKLMSAFLDAVNVASVAVIVVVCLRMGQIAIVDWRTGLILALSLVFVLRFKSVNAMWIVVGSSLLGYLLTLV
ncbi:chromate efflux transporter [Spirosoma sp. HMF4905]|uniref:Chromate efflux transporter n=1 Tax=Spirosoma arboris TaxID=2682092 RepID=A0A7K1SJI8_9BACT|nr:chromate efflux transporter [Spirosoma arboris]MVM33962.1 chromate efflux transporter [Spirosoma arboris]